MATLDASGEALVLKQLVPVAVVVFLIIAGIAVLLLRRMPGKGAEAWPFYAKKPLSQPEQVLYHRLVAALPECMVLAQVQLSRVLGVKKGFRFHEWNNRINRMSLDFLVCLKDSSIVAAIELDDKSHERAARMEVDAKKEKALAAAGITLVRWHVSAMPDEATIRKVFAG